MMTLLSTTRALDDQNFKWKVMGASLVQAAGFNSMTVAQGKYYALTTILYPQTVDMTMVAFVAMDPAVAAAIVTSETGSVDTSAVTDADIQRVVTARWALVGNKYKVDPLAPPVTP
jgi:hypothetical protein